MIFDQPYLAFDATRLEAEYSPSSMVDGDISGFLATAERMGIEARSTLPVHQNLRYGPRPDAVLDYFPAAATHAPLHIFVHGGYWQALSHKDGGLLAPVFHSAGINFASINYGLAPQTRIGTMVEQVSGAVSWLIGQADELGFDAGRITLSGHSAGAHLAASALRIDAEPRPKIARLVLLSGIFDLRPLRHTSVNDPLNLTEREAESLSLLPGPIIDAPIVDVIVAEHDTNEFRRQARAYTDHLNSGPNTVSFAEFPGLNHFSLIKAAADPESEVFRRMANFTSMRPDDETYGMGRG